MKCVLLTGATGAIGSALVPRLLQEPETSVRLLLRAASEEHLRERLGRLFAFWGVDPADSLARRVTALRGDVSAPLLGLGQGDYRALAGQVTHLVHAAGNVRLNQPLADARRDAVEAARHVVALARACQANGTFAKLEFLSTVGVAGRTRGLVPEEPLTGPRAFHNTYEAAKAEAEAYLLDEIRAGLPATIHRPSMVIGDSRTGKIVHFQVFYYLGEFLAGRRTFGVIPETGGVKLDIIPVDYVAAAIQHSVNRPDAAGRIMHLCSGPESAPTLAALTEQVRVLFRQHGRELPSLRKWPRGLVKAIVLVGGRVTIGRTRKALQTLPYFLAYLDEEQVFDNRATQAFFQKEGLQVPPVEEYLPRVMDYYLAVKKGE